MYYEVTVKAERGSFNEYIHAYTAYDAVKLCTERYERAYKDKIHEVIVRELDENL